MYSLFDFAKVRIFPLFWKLRHFHYWAFKLTYSVEDNLSYQPRKFQFSTLSESFTSGRWEVGGGWDQCRTILFPITKATFKIVIMKRNK